MSTFVQALIAADWEGAYRLSSVQRHEKLESFLARTKRLRRLREFQASEVVADREDGFWNIHGCAIFDGHAGKKGRLVNLRIQLSDGVWYMSPIAIRLFGDERKMYSKPCQIAPA